MKPTASQGWALGTFALAVLIACSPPAATTVVEQPVTPPVQRSSSISSVPIGPPPANIDPGFAGTWASIETDCGDPAKTVALSPKSISLKQGDGDCAVKSIEEEHPSGRSMSYTIVASCVASDRTGEDTFRINFGPSDTAVQFQQNAREPVRLVRCPNP
ncbi:MAG: hypothetical protein Q8R82_10020 [Hyphomonadaceae bacterium]|nr:hypothetical protein [Hyphomonadaceae bacterium]